MVKFVDTDFGELMPGQNFTIKWEYESPNTSEEIRARGVSIDFQLRPLGNAANHHIWLGDSQGNGNPGLSYDWDVPVNIPYRSAVATVVISEVSRTFNGITASTTAFVITNTPSATDSAASTLPYCTDDAATNCINAPSLNTFVPSTTVSSIADPTLSSDSIATTLVISRINASPTTPTPTSLSSSADQDSSPHHLEPGATVGIGIGAVVAAIIIAVVGFFFYKYGKRRALAKDNTTEYSKSWTASGGGKPDPSAEPLQKAGEGDDFRKAELDATPTPAPAYTERVAGSGGEGGSETYVQPDEGRSRAELVGSTDWGLQPAPMANTGGELEDTSNKKAAIKTDWELEDTSDKKVADETGKKASDDHNGIGEAVSTDN